MLLIVLSNLRFLVCQGLALRGNGDGFNRNFVQLLQLHRLNCGDIDVGSWLAKRLISTQLQMYKMNAWS